MDLAANNCGHACYPFNYVSYLPVGWFEVGAKGQCAEDVLGRRRLPPLFPQPAEVNRHRSRALLRRGLHPKPGGVGAIDATDTRVRDDHTREAESRRDIHFLKEVVVWILACTRGLNPAKRDNADKGSAAGDDAFDPLAISEPLLVTSISNQAEALFDKGE